MGTTRSSRWVVRGVIGLLLAQVALTAGTTQVRAWRRLTPWQDDPWNVAVTVALVAVPVVLVGLVGSRLLAGGAPGPRTVRGARWGAGVVAATGLVQLAAAASGAHGSSWQGGTSWLVAAVALLTALAGAALASTRRLLPGRADATSRGEALALPGRVGRRVEDQLLASTWGVRRHPVAWTVGTAEAVTSVLVLGMWWGEGASPLLVGPLDAVLGGAAFSVVLVLAQRSVHLVDVSPGRRSARRLGLGAAVGVVTAFVVVGVREPLVTTYAAMAGGAALGALVTAVTTPLVRRRAASAWRGPSSSRR